ncbi:MAG: hypothetical protein KGN02_04510 [bacterium]|nr:hypothetical protein [bacterium]
MNATERGESLVSVVVGVAIAAVATTAAIAGTLAAARHFGPDPVATALEQSARRELRVAVDLAKYRGAILPPTSIATTIPLPSASPLDATLSFTATPHADGSIDLRVRAASVTDPSERASAATTIPAPAPLPSSLVPATAGAAAPQ